jgi:NADPH2:quinone reductase
MPIGYSPEFLQDVHSDLLDHWHNGSLRAHNNQVFDFEDALQAIEHIAAGKVEGKVVVRVCPL